MVNYKGLWSKTTKTIKECLEENNDFKLVTGDVDYSKQSYPLIQFFFQNSIYQGNGKYRDVYNLLFMFERSHSVTEIIKNMEKVEETTTEVHRVINKDSNTVNFQAGEIENLVGEYEDTLIDAYRVNFEVEKLISMKPKRLKGGESNG